MTLDELDISYIRRWLEDQDVESEYRASYTKDETATKILEVVTKIYEDLLGDIPPTSRDPIGYYCPPELRQSYVEPEALKKQIPIEALKRGRK